MFDVFYSGIKPNRFAHEQQADSIDHARELSRTRYFWWINYLTDYADFDFLYEPVPWQSHQRHAWPSQWQKDAETYLVPKQGYTETNYKTTPALTRLQDRSNWTIPDTFDPDSFDFSWHPDTTEPGYIYQFGTQHQRTGGPQYCVEGATDLKFCDQVRGSVKSGATPIVEINHMDGNAGQVAGVVSTVRYFDNYKDILTRIANTSEHEYIWIVSSVCDYSNFDFSWHPELWQNTMLHVFASSGEKFGDTFYMHVPSFRKRIGQFELLDWYDLNFVGPGVTRRPLPVIQHTFDTHVEAIKTIDWAGPLAVFSTNDQVETIPTVSLWRENTKTVVPLSPSGAAVIVPRECKNYLKTQLYDYPYIDKTKKSTQPMQLQDIVFISYDEPEADINWNMLQSKYARAKRVHGVEGMENALAAAAELSSTAWYFAVFGKTELYPGFDFVFQPDYLQQPKHYIFYSENRVNKLVYGEMAIIMYNCRLILENQNKEFGLDYTLSFPHEVVPIISTYGNFDTSPYHTWRTAFREVSKLYDMQEKSPSIDTEYRINIWETVAKGDYAEWALSGAKDGREFYYKYKDDFAYRKNSFNWQWLRNYFSALYGEVN
jgi:hypothetical protein